MVLVLEEKNWLEKGLPCINLLILYQMNEMPIINNDNSHATMSQVLHIDQELY